MARVPHKGNNLKTVAITFSRDGQNLEHHHCDCCWKYKNPPVCRHIVATVLAIQGGIVESKLTLGKTSTASTVVNESNTAKAVGSGSLLVFATPMMIALMERAAYECLEDCLLDGQTSVGIEINVEHTAASLPGTPIIATATLEYVFGRRVELKVTASDGAGEIGSGKHTRIIVEKNQSERDALNCSK